jgi:hypothetical protein
MGDNGMGQFLARIETDAGLREELRAAGFGAGMAVDDVVAFAARKGYKLLADDGDELADAQLDKVAGGTDGSDDADLSLRLAAYAERRAKFQETLSNMMKKMSDTQNAIVNNLK